MASIAAPRYDFVWSMRYRISLQPIIPDPQTLKKPGNFLLCGDSNQIVIPTFSLGDGKKPVLARSKTCRAAGVACAQRQIFRNGWRQRARPINCSRSSNSASAPLTRRAIFWSAVGGEMGQVALMADKDSVLHELDQKVRLSTQFAVAGHAR